MQLVDAFCARLDAILPWDRIAVDATTEIKVALRLAGTPIGPNDTAIAGHAIAAGAILVTNNIRVFARMLGLTLDVLNQSKPVLIIFYLEQFFNRFCRVKERVTVFFL